MTQLELQPQPVDTSATAAEAMLCTFSNAPVRSRSTAAQAVQSYLTVTRAEPTPLDKFERRLWAAILLALFEDVSRGGRGCVAYRDAMRDIEGLEFVMGCLGYDEGAGRKLLEAAVGQFEKSREKNSALGTLVA